MNAKNSFKSKDFYTFGLSVGLVVELTVFGGNIDNDEFEHFSYEKVRIDM